MQIVRDDVARSLSLRLLSFSDCDEVECPFAPVVEVHNASDLDLTSNGETPVHLSYHWLDADSGEVRVWDGIRTVLDPPLEAKSRRAYTLRALTPGPPGRYRFQACLVQEGVTWLEGVARVTQCGDVLQVAKKPWWEPGDTDVLYSAQDELNRKRYREYLFHGEACRPIALFCETVNRCNNSCVICAYDRQSRPKGTMRMELFEKLLKDYSDLGGGHLSLTPVVGEVFLDCHLMERVRLAKASRTIRSLSFTTNASAACLLSDAELEYVLNATRRVQVSIYGLNEAEFRAMTRRDSYPQLLRELNRILRFAINEVVLAPRLLFLRAPAELTCWVEALDAYRESRATIVVSEPAYMHANWGVFDTASVLPGDARWREVPGDKQQCLVPLLGCQVFWDGNVSFCPCDDFDSARSLHLGNLAESTLSGLYNSQRSRELWDWKTRGVPEFCRRCSFYVPLSDAGKNGDIFADPLVIAGA